MSKVFIGNVSIVKNTRGEIALRRDPEGQFSAANATEIYQKMTQLSKKLEIPINKYSMFIVDGKGEPVLLTNRYGSPYIALLPKQSNSNQQRRQGVVKLA